jgi:hypothetical protein
LQQRVDAVGRDQPARVRHGRGQAWLELFPLRGERSLPVIVEEPGETTDELVRVVEDERGQLRARAEVPADGERVRAHGRVGEQRRVTPPLVVVERSEELEPERLPVESLQVLQLLVEAPEAGLRRGGQEVGHHPPVDEAELGDAAAESGRERPHATDPLVLERMVLRLGEHVQAERGFQRRRVREREPVEAVRGNVEADRHRFPFWRKS